MQSSILLTVIMPCLNEARSLAACIEQAHAGCRTALEHQPTVAIQEDASALAHYEIVVADNGSTDGSQAIAVAAGARVVDVADKGYGAAIRGGIATARGKYIVMGDSDGSYDFGDIPRFFEKLEEGYDLVMGNRFAGGIMPGAMPWHHRYIGNPVLSGIGRLLYRTPCKDWHCGLRAFNREKVLDLELKSSGMEFASEIVARCSQENLRASEISTNLYPDKRDRPPHLRSIRDGLRHLKFLICNHRLLSRRHRDQSQPVTRYANYIVAFLCVVFSILVFSSSLGFNVFGGSVATATFDNPVLIRAEHWQGRHQPIECIIHSAEEVHLIGARVPCPCLSTKDLPIKIPANSTHKVMFDLNLEALKGTPKGKLEPARIELIASDSRLNIRTTLQLSAQFDLVEVPKE